jgi:acyl-CoA synthetase (AMP-forming)/AMP-acid ligase II
MLNIHDDTTIPEAFAQAVSRYGDRPFIEVPVNASREYLPEGYSISYVNAAIQVATIAGALQRAGYGAGHFIALMIGNRPEHLLWKLAINGVGACCVPLNAEQRPNELAYVLDHAQVALVIVAPQHAQLLDAAGALSQNQPSAGVFDAVLKDLPTALIPAGAAPLTSHTPASILYTSGTTGKPKGCVLSHQYELASGAWYANQGGLVSIREGEERLFNALPLYHVNASILSFYCMMLSGGCQIQTDRFSPNRWWPEVQQTRATIVHYLGVIVAMLMNQPESNDQWHSVRLGYGAGVEPQLHAAFEARFGFPLIEIWGMTETVRTLGDYVTPRQVGTRAMGRSLPTLEARVVNDRDELVATNAQGELVVRHSETTPRKYFFSGYLHDGAATEAAWRDGWFHTGDVVTQDETGMIHFVDRRKNIVRRAGENIAAAEVEAVLLTHPDVLQAAVLAFPDAVREEEVLACVVAKQPVTIDQREALAQSIFTHCMGELAYFKAPGWIWFTDSIPTTGTQKIQKHQLFPLGADICAQPGMIDLRSQKRRA